MTGRSAQRLKKIGLAGKTLQAGPLLVLQGPLRSGGGHVPTSSCGTLQRLQTRSHPQERVSSGMGRGVRVGNHFTAAADEVRCRRLLHRKAGREVGQRGEQ